MPMVDGKTLRKAEGGLLFPPVGSYGPSDFNKGNIIEETFLKMSHLRYLGTHQSPTTDTWVCSIYTWICTKICTKYPWVVSTNTRVYVHIGLYYPIGVLLGTWIQYPHLDMLGSAFANKGINMPNPYKPMVCLGPGPYSCSIHQRRCA